MRRRARTFGRAWGRRAARWHVLGDAPCLPRGLKRGPSAVEATEGEKRVREEGNDAGKEVWNRAFNARAARGYRIHGVATRAARQQSHGGSPQARRTFQRTGEGAARAFEESLPPSVAFARPS